MAGAESPQEHLVQLEGTLGFSVACELRFIALNAALSSSSVTIDCSKVDRVDSSALQILQSLANQLVQSGRQLHLLGLNDSVRDYIQLAGFRALIGERGP